MARRSKKFLDEIMGLSNLPSAADKKKKLKFERSCLVKDAYPIKKKKGKHVCRRCHGDVPAPRKYWCSDACVYDAMIRCTPSEAMKWVRIRDRGVCALCGIDTKKLSQIMSDEELKAQGYKWGYNFWQADHIIPVVEGGGHCSLDNYRTLCIPCHRGETNKLRARMKKPK